MIPGTRLDWKSAGLFCVADPEWKKKIGLGGFFLLIPVLGWPIILGYRKETAFRLVQGLLPILPNWEMGLPFFLREGLKAMGVIHSYFLPVYVWFGFRVFSHPASLEIPWLWFALFFFLFPIFSTLIIPILLLYVQLTQPESLLSIGESIGMTTAYAFLTFFLPAGFLNVSRTGCLLSAFNIARNFRLILHTLPAYLEAWIGSSLMSLVGHLCVPFSPWGIVWCYLGIIYSFNEVPLTMSARVDSSYLSQSWFPSFRTQYWERFTFVQSGSLEHHFRHSDPLPFHTFHTEDFSAIKLSFLRAPIR